MLWPKRSEPNRTASFVNLRSDWSQRGRHRTLQCCGVDCLSNAVIMWWIKSRLAVLWWSQTLWCVICVFHATVFSEMKLFAVLAFLVRPFSDLNLARKLPWSVLIYSCIVSATLTIEPLWGLQWFYLIKLSIIVFKIQTNQYRTTLSS